MSYARVEVYDKWEVAQEISFYACRGQLAPIWRAGSIFGSVAWDKPVQDDGQIPNPVRYCASLLLGTRFGQKRKAFVCTVKIHIAHLGNQLQ